MFEEDDNRKIRRDRTIQRERTLEYPNAPLPPKYAISLSRLKPILCAAIENWNTIVPEDPKFLTSEERLAAHVIEQAIAEHTRYGSHADDKELSIYPSIFRLYLAKHLKDLRVPAMADETPDAVEAKRKALESAADAIVSNAPGYFVEIARDAMNSPQSARNALN